MNDARKPPKPPRAAPGTPTYPGGFDAVLAQMDKRRAPLVLAPGEALPPLDCDLAALRAARVDPEAPEVAGSDSTHARKLRDLSRELAGKSGLCLLNALLIAHLRKEDQPPHAAALFQRLWAEEGAHLLANLDARWLVSSITTFGEHGATEVQRRCGLSLTVLFSMMKLYETERLFSGLPPERAHPWDTRITAPLPLEMDAYSVPSGGLDVNMLGRLWRDAEGDAVIAPLAHHLLDLLNDDPRTLFRRLATMKARHRKMKRARSRAARAPDDTPNPVPVPGATLGLAPGDIRWGVVATVRAPLRDIARFAAHHLEMGAARVTLYLDDPDPAVAEVLARNPRIEVISCDAAWWARRKKDRMAAHQLRQAHNATRSYRRSDLHWLAHIDVDEFILSPLPLPELLAAAPEGDCAMRLVPAELLSPAPGQPARHFKLDPASVGRPKAVLQDIYPDFGLHLRGGFISHTSGKIVARCGVPGARLGVHALVHKGRPASNVSDLGRAYLGHLHAPSWEHFTRHLEFRLSRGSYRKDDEAAFRLGDVIDYLQREEGDEALRGFFAQVCEDSAGLRDRLRAHDMLLEHRLDLDAAVKRVYGALPETGHG